MTDLNNPLFFEGEEWEDDEEEDWGGEEEDDEEEELEEEEEDDEEEELEWEVLGPEPHQELEWDELEMGSKENKQQNEYCNKLKAIKPDQSSSGTCFFIASLLVLLRLPIGSKDNNPETASKNRLMLKRIIRSYLNHGVCPRLPKNIKNVMKEHIMSNDNNRITITKVEDSKESFSGNFPGKKELVTLLTSLSELNIELNMTDSLILSNSSNIDKLNSVVHYYIMSMKSEIDEKYVLQIGYNKFEAHIQFELGGQAERVLESLLLWAGYNIPDDVKVNIQDEYHPGISQTNNELINIFPDVGILDIFMSNGDAHSICVFKCMNDEGVFKPYYINTWGEGVKPLQELKSELKQVSIVIKIISISTPLKSPPNSKYVSLDIHPFKHYKKFNNPEELAHSQQLCYDIHSYWNKLYEEDENKYWSFLNKKDKDLELCLDLLTGGKTQESLEEFKKSDKSKEYTTINKTLNITDKAYERYLLKIFLMDKLLKLKSGFLLYDEFIEKDEFIEEVEKPVLTREQFNKLSSEEKNNYIQISRPKKRQMPKTVKPIFSIRKEEPIKEPPKKRHKPS